MDTFSDVPPGFRFYPTDEELVDYYLRKKVASRRIDLDVIKEIDLYKIEPWDLQEKCKIGTEEQNDWYFFSHKDKKYPTGTRTNRATTAGFWKATGRDKSIYSKHSLIGMRKTLVFYRGRAPNGQKSDWIMHEYRLETNENGPPQEEGWAVCRVFKKRITAIQNMSEHYSLRSYDDQVSFMPDLDSPKRLAPDMGYHYPYSYKKELEMLIHVPHDPFLQLPQLESPKLPNSTGTVSCNSVNAYGLDINHRNTFQVSHLTQVQMHQSHPNPMNSICNNSTEQAVDQVIDWRVLDKFVASQLSHEDVLKDTNYSNSSNVLHVSDHMNPLLQQSHGPETVAECASTPTSSCEIDMWK